MLRISFLLVSGWTVLAERTALILLLALAAGVVFAEQIPAWMKPAQASLADDRKMVWLVIAESGKEKPLADLRISESAAFVETREGRRFLYDFHFVQRKDGMNFNLGRNDIAVIHYYTAREGAPVRYDYAPRLVMKNGQSIEGNAGRDNPEGRLKPSLLRFDKTEVVEFAGQRRERLASGAFPHPILAFSWTRDDAERARDEIILQAARKERNHVLVKWNEQQRIHHPAGIVEVKTVGKADYGFINKRGDFGHWSWGKLSFDVNGQEHRFGEWKFFTKPFPLTDPTGMFSSMLVGLEGVHFYYPTGVRYDSVSDVDLRLLNAIFSFQN